MTDVWQERIDSIVDAVRNDLREAHSLTELASHANSSKHHFHRRFLAVTGETPLQFVRRSRLERAAYLMMASPDRTLTDIGHEVGFSETSAFSRSFRQMYGIAPSKWKRNPRPVTSAADSTPTVQITTHPAMTLASIRARGVFGLDDLSPSFDRLCAWMQDNGLDLDRSTLVGMSSDNYRLTPLDRVTYSFGFSVSPGASASRGIHVKHLPAFTAATISIDGGLPDIAAAWDHLYDEWFPSRRWEPSSLPAMKLFRRRPDELGWSRFDLDCAVAFRLDGGR